MFGVNLSTLILTLFVSSFGAHASEDIFKSLGTKPGTLTVTKSNADHCTNGPLKLVGSKDEEVLMVGSNITFYLPGKEKEITATADDKQCAEEVQSVLEKNELKMTTTVHSCPLKLKFVEGKITETLSVSHNIVKYQRFADKDKKIECTFQWRMK